VSVAQPRVTTDPEPFAGAILAEAWSVAADGMKQPVHKTHRYGFTCFAPLPALGMVPGICALTVIGLFRALPVCAIAPASACCERLAATDTIDHA
jgi:hypothetical protein